MHHRKALPLSQLPSALDGGNWPRHMLTTAILAVLYAAPAHANPNGAQVVAGQVHIDSSIPGRMTITNSPNAIINWQDFSVQPNEITQFVQSSSASAVLNRVVGGDPSQILGQLLSNGKVVLINPNGIVFGAGSRISVQGLVASTLNLTNEAFLEGAYHFSAVPNAGGITNEGLITAGADGNIVLIAPQINNGGTIQTEGGRIVLAAGEALTLTSLDQPEISFQIQAPDNGVLNLGQLLAEGGVIDLFAGSILHEGVISASAVSRDAEGNIRLIAADDITLGAGSLITANGDQFNDGGRISLQVLGQADDASVIHQQGDLIAEGRQGGQVEISGDSLQADGRISVDGIDQGGQVRIVAENRILASHSSQITADSQGQGGEILLEAATLFTSGHHSAGGDLGGAVALLGDEVQLAAAHIDVSATQAGGTVLIGGGLGGLEVGVRNARNTTVNSSSVIHADALDRGDGGTVAVWADGATRFSGTITARGGPQGGDGGFVEVSGASGLGFDGLVDVGANQGAGGTLRLDPRNIEVVATTNSAGAATGSVTLIDPTAGAGDLFGEATLQMSNGDLLIINPNDDFAGSDAGAAYIFAADDGSLLSSLVGAGSGDMLGSGGVSELSGGFIAIHSPEFGGVGAVSFVDTLVGLGGGALSQTNSLTGAATGDLSQIEFVLDVGSGKVLMAASSFGGFGGSMTWIDAAGGINTAGIVSSANSLIGTAVDGGGVILDPVFLGGDRYAILGSGWDQSGAADAGAVTFIDMSTGSLIHDGSAIAGSIGSGNSLVGSSAGDQVGWDFNLVSSSGWVLLEHDFWNGGSGAWTYANASSNTNLTGTVSASNSFTGDPVGNGVGLRNWFGLGGDSYALLAPDWGVAGQESAGAIAFVNLGDGTFIHDGSAFAGTVSASNSLVGSSAFDQIGNNVLDLDSSAGWIVFAHNNWNDNAGAVTYSSILSQQNLTGAVSASNSLVGETVDSIQAFIRSLDLGSGRLAIYNSGWDLGGNSNAGAVTFLDTVEGTFIHDGSPFAGGITASNSLVGAAAGDRVGQNVLLSGTDWILTNAPNWNAAGAVTYSNVLSGKNLIGNVSSANSLVGARIDAAAVNLSSFSNTQFLGNDRYALYSPAWDVGTAANAGAVTFVNVNDGTFTHDGSDFAGLISAANSLVGSSAGDGVGSRRISNGSDWVLFEHANWGGGAGALTYSNVQTATHLTGAVDSRNSLVGAAIDGGGSFVNQFSFSNDLAAIYSANWDVGNNANAGAITFVDLGSGTFLHDGASLVGSIDETNSLVGSAPNDRVGSSVLEGNFSNGWLLFNHSQWNGGAGAISYSNVVADTNLTGLVGASNSLVGERVDATGIAPFVVNLGGNNRAILNDDWDIGVDANIGAVTFVDVGSGSFLHDGSPLLGTVAASNSLVGSRGGDRVGLSSVTSSSSGWILLSHGQWNGGAGALTYASTSGTNLTGVVSSSNSLVGSQVDGSGVFNSSVSLGADRYAIYSSDWDVGVDADVGAVVFADLGSGTFIHDGAALVGLVSAGNALVGGNAQDRVGDRFLRSGGSAGWILFEHADWNAGAGAISYSNVGNDRNLVGVVSAANSLVGSGLDANRNSSFTLNLGGDNLAIFNRFWDVGSVADAGAVTFINTASGTFVHDGSDMAGAVSASNSLVGSNVGDGVGYSWVDANTSTGWVMLEHPSWNGGAGALTYANVATNRNLVGTVSASNSLVGEAVSGSSVFVNDLFFTSDIRGFYSASWDVAGAANAGGITLVDVSNGTFVHDGTPVAGIVSASNSLVGGRSSDFVSSGGFTFLFNPSTGVSEYSMHSPLWDSATATDAGALTHLSIAGALVGTLDVADGITGVGTNDVATFSVDSLFPFGRYLVSVPQLDTVDGVDAGTVVLINNISDVAPASSVSFTDNPGSELQVGADAIMAALAQGSTLQLQADNDITLNAPITVVSGSGTLSLEAGRSVLINASVNTGDGDFTAVANSSNASVTERAGGDGSIVMASNTTINAGTGQINLTIDDGVQAGTFDLRPLFATLINYNFVPSGGLPNSGVLTVAAGSSTTINGGLDNSGTIAFGAGSVLTLSGDLTNSGTLSGFGTINGNVVNQGALLPGASPGAIAINGDLTLGSNSSLAIDIAGLSPALVGSGSSPGGYDFIDVSGNVVLGGALEVNTSPYTNQAVNDAFELIRAGGSMTGGFSSVSYQNGYRYSLAVSNSNALRATLTALPAETVAPAVVTAVSVEQQAELVTMVEQTHVVEPLSAELGAAVPSSDSSDPASEEDEASMTPVVGEVDSTFGSTSEYNRLGQCK